MRGGRWDCPSPGSPRFGSHFPHCALGRHHQLISTLCLLLSHHTWVPYSCIQLPSEWLLLQTHPRLISILSVPTVTRPETQVWPWTSIPSLLTSNRLGSHVYSSSQISLICPLLSIPIALRRSTRASGSKTEGERGRWLRPKDLQTWIWISASLPLGHVTWSEWLHLLKPQFPQMEKCHHNHTYMSSHRAWHIVLVNRSYCCCLWHAFPNFNLSLVTFVIIISSVLLFS